MEVSGNKASISLFYEHFAVISLHLFYRQDEQPVLLMLPDDEKQKRMENKVMSVLIPQVTKYR